MIIPVVYFSSSNNTAYVAQLIARGIESPGLKPELVRVEDAGAGKYDLKDMEIMGVGAPIYGGFAEPVLRWARDFDFTGKRIFLFSTANKHHFSSTRQMTDVVRKNGGRVIGALEMKFPGSIEGVFFSRKKADRHPLERSELERALRFGQDVAAIVQKGEGYADYTYPHRFGVSLMPLVRAIKKAIAGIIKRGLFESSCAGCTGKSCGACASVCPVNAIKVRERCAEIDKSKCIACFRCFKECPGGTFSVRLAKDREYYRGPWQLKGYVKPEDLAREAGKAKPGR
ncbi:MAG TPA: EFR1 family ferrodoxin [Methanocella sp.]|jgi:ferredoxin